MDNIQLSEIFNKMYDDDRHEKYKQRNISKFNITKLVLFLSVIVFCVLAIYIVIKLLRAITRQQQMRQQIKQQEYQPNKVIIIAKTQDGLQQEIQQPITTQQQQIEQSTEETTQQTTQQTKQETTQQPKQETTQETEKETKQETEKETTQEMQQINKEDLIKLMTLKSNINEMNNITNNNIKTLQKITEKYNDIDNSIKDIKNLYEKIEIVKIPEQKAIKKEQQETKQETEE